MEWKCILDYEEEHLKNNKQTNHNKKANFHGKYIIIPFKSKYALTLEESWEWVPFSNFIRFIFVVVGGCGIKMLHSDKA